MATYVRLWGPTGNTTRYGGVREDQAGANREHSVRGSTPERAGAQVPDDSPLCAHQNGTRIAPHIRAREKQKIGPRGSQ